MPYEYRQGMLSAIYWKLHTNFLMNYQEDAWRFLSMIEDEARLSPAGQLASELGPTHMGRYLKIKERMRLGLYMRLSGDGASSPISQWCPPSDRESGEKAFCSKLCTRKGKAFLFNLLGAPADAVVVDEFDMGVYGRCDLVVQEGRVRWVVEVKIGKAPDSVVSQVDKYRLSEELQMCLGLHDEVRPFVLARSFPPYVASELSRNGIEMILHDGRPESLRTMASNERKEGARWEQDPMMDPTMVW
jgi:hypothetical protein